MYKDEIVPHMELLHIWVDCSSDLLDPILEAWLKWELSNDEWSHIWLILDWSIVEEHMSISMYDFLLTHLCSVISIAVICHAWGIGLGLSSYSGISPHSWSELMGYICLIHWWLDCDYYGIFWRFLCLYLFCGCLVVDVKVNFWIWYDWLIICLFYCLELLMRFLWGLLSVAIIRIHIHSCDIYISNRKTSSVCKDKLICFVAGYLLDAGHESVRYWYGVPTPFGDIFCQVKTHKSESPLFISTCSKENITFGQW